MCKLLDIPRSSLYYNYNKNLKKKKFNDHYLTDLIKRNIQKQPKQLRFKKD